jgi:4-amino-4-deoxy-L-arabinose transferase-like glycosyltransferase
MANVRSPLFIIILAVYIIAGGLYAFLTPAWQAPDEPAHYNYVRNLVSQPGFPRLVANCYNQTYLDQIKAQRFSPDMSINGICYEFHQPPFYYLLGMPVFVLTGGRLPLLRFLSMALLGGGVIVLAFFIGRTIFPNKPPIAYGTMAFVAFVPMHLAIQSSINNDTLAELILAIILFILAQRLMATPEHQPKHYVQNNWLLGIILGLGLGTKITVYIALPLIFVALWWTSSAKTQARDWRKLARESATIYGVAFIIVLPWFIRNAIVYGNVDILGLVRHNQIVTGQLRTTDYIAEVGILNYLLNFVITTYHSFWGQFGWMAVPMDGRSYLMVTLLCLTASGGLIGFWWNVRSEKNTTTEYDASTSQRHALGLMGFTILFMALGYLWYNITFLQLQGRYLFPALIPLGIFFALGLSEALSPRWMWWLAGGLGVVLTWILISGLRQNNLDKWAVLFIGLAFAGAIARAFLARIRQIPTAWLMTVCYSLLAALALVSPFWFIVPYLSP